MSLTKCKKCGELYADSYKTCPFCAEDAEYYNGRVKKSVRRPNEKKVKRPSAVGPVLILVVLLILAALAWIIFGGHIGDILGSSQPAQPVQPVQQEQVDTPEPGDVVVPETLVLDRTSLLLSVGSSETLHVEGEENVEWQSSDPTIAVVTSSGTVKGLAEGTAIISAACDDRTATCSVSVAEEVQTQDPGNDEPITVDKPTKPDAPTKPDNQTQSKVDLSKLTISVPSYGTTLPKDTEGNFDTSMSVNESYQLKVEGVSGKVTWSSSNTGAVTVDSDGTLKRVARGEAIITGKIGTESFTIRVRNQ